MSGYSIVDVAAFDCDVIAADWRFETDEAEAIERNWDRRVRATPEIYNGRVMLLHHGEVTPQQDGLPVFHGACFETSFKSFLAWRDLGFPPVGVRNCFAMAALESADGAFVLGEMNRHTAPAGQVYFPSGTPDRKDVIEGKVDLEASVRRELTEETGLDPVALNFEPGLTLVMNATRVCCMKRVRAPANADELVASIHAWLAHDPQPELARMHIVRAESDITGAMPAFVAHYLRERLR